MNAKTVRAKDTHQLLRKGNIRLDGLTRTVKGFHNMCLAHTIFTDEHIDATRKVHIEFM